MMEIQTANVGAGYTVDPVTGDLIEKFGNGFERRWIAQADGSFAPTVAQVGGGGGGSTAGLATTAKQDALRDSVLRESATTQNILVQLSNVGPAHITEFVTADVYSVDAAHGGAGAGDQVLRLQTHAVALTADPLMPYWTTPVEVSWVRIFDASTSQHIRQTLGAALDTDKATQITSALVTKTSFERTVTRRVLDASLVESLQDVTETRVVQSSHIPPYPEVFDSGWV